MCRYASGRDVWIFSCRLQSSGLCSTVLDHSGGMIHLQVPQGSRNRAPAATAPAAFREGDFTIAIEKMPPTAVRFTEWSPTDGVSPENHFFLFNRDKVGPPKCL